jgi:predicted transcriptional regulator of viral defense system
VTFKSEMDVRALRQATERNAYIESTQKVIKLNSEQDNEMITQVDLSRLRAYQNEIKLTREQRDIEMTMRKQLTEKILATWRLLKDLRVRQGFRNTEFKLIIKKLHSI